MPRRYRTLVPLSPSDLRLPPSKSHSAIPQPESRLSVGRAWKFRRNLVISIAHKHGVAQRVLADVFDLPHSRIAAIVKEFRVKYGSESEGLPFKTDD